MNWAAKYSLALLEWARDHFQEALRDHLNILRKGIFWGHTTPKYYIRFLKTTYPLEKNTKIKRNFIKICLGAMLTFR